MSCNYILFYDCDISGGFFKSAKYISVFMTDGLMCVCVYSVVKDLVVLCVVVRKQLECILPRLGYDPILGVLSICSPVPFLCRNFIAVIQ